MNIVISGAGEVGKHLAKILAYDNHNITVIDVSQSELQLLSLHLDILTIEGSALSISVLTQAKVDECDLYIAVTHFPEMNVASAVIAKQLGAPQTIARVRNPELLEEKNVLLFKGMGIDSIIYPQALAADEISKFIQQSATREFFDFADGLLSLFVLKIDETNDVVGKYLEEINGHSEDLENFRVIAIKRNFSTIIPKGDEICKPEDLVYIVSNKKGVKPMLDTFGKKKLAIDKIIILGGSRTGQATAKLLQNQFDVKLIEIDTRKAHKLANSLDNTLIINGDGRSTDLLVEEGVRNTDVFIATTGNSETNILSCYLAKRIGVKRTIAEVENMDYVSLAIDIGIDTVINKKNIAANAIHKFTLGEKTEISSARHLTQSEAQILEINVHGSMKVCKAPLSEIDFPDEAVIGGVVRKKNAFIATGTTHIQDGDKVLVFCMPTAMNEVQKLFEKSKKSKNKES
ncbi:MAG: Trk system potassium transporter TrkA [Bacteroidota bacterium]